MSVYDKDGFSKDGYHRIHRNVLNGDLKAVQEELNNGTDVSIETRNDYKRTALHHAAVSANNEIVKLLVSKGANLNKLDLMQDTALMIAARGGYQEIVKTLLAAKADA